METFTPEQRQALQNAHQQVVQAAAQQAQQAQQELTERVAALQLELDRARGARRTEAGMTGKPIPLNRTGGNWEEFNLKLKAFVGLRSEPLVRVMERMEEPNAVDRDLEDLEGVSIDIGTDNRNLYYDFTMLTTGTTLKLVSRATTGWRHTGSCVADGTLVREAATWRGCRRSCSGTSARPPPRPWTAWPHGSPRLRSGSSSPGNGWPIPSSCASWTRRRPRSLVPASACTHRQRRPLPQ